MRPVVNLDHLFHRDLRIYLRRRKPCVAEQFLDVAEVCALIKQVCCKGVPQRMRRYVMNIGALFDVFVDEASDGTGGDPRALIV